VKRRTLAVLAFLGSGAAVGAWLIARLPSRADCLQRGGSIDSTYRHCIGSGGEETLREHIVGHLITALPVIVAVLILAGLIHRLQRRRSSS
jgi:hypothetical protein